MYYAIFMFGFLAPVRWAGEQVSKICDNTSLVVARTLTPHWRTRALELNDSRCRHAMPLYSGLGPGDPAQQTQELASIGLVLWHTDAGNTAAEGGALLTGVPGIHPGRAGILVHALGSQVSVDLKITDCRAPLAGLWHGCCSLSRWCCSRAPAVAGGFVGAPSQASTRGPWVKVL